MWVSEGMGTNSGYHKEASRHPYGDNGSVNLQGKDQVGTPTFNILETPLFKVDLRYRGHRFHHLASQRYRREHCLYIRLCVK